MVYSEFEKTPVSNACTSATSPYVNKGENAAHSCVMCLCVLCVYVCYVFSGTLIFSDLKLCLHVERKPKHVEKSIFISVSISFDSTFAALL